MSATQDERCPTCGETRSLLSIRAAAELVGVNRKTIYRWIEAGLLDYRRLPSRAIRIYEESLLKVPRRGSGEPGRGEDRRKRDKAARSPSSRNGSNGAQAGTA